MELEKLKTENIELQAANKGSHLDESVVDELKKQVYEQNETIDNLRTQL